MTKYRVDADYARQQIDELMQWYQDIGKEVLPEYREDETDAEKAYEFGKAAGASEALHAVYLMLFGGHAMMKWMLEHVLKS